MQRGSIRTAALVSTALLGVLATRGAAQEAPAAAPSTAAAALALEASELGLLNTLVTAEGRRAPLQSTAVALTALSSEQLDARGIITTPQLARIVPNLIATPTPGLGLTNDYTLRGLGGGARAGSDAAVGTFIDNVHVPTPAADSLRGFDLDRVEVLRGPQGTLYGHGTTAGVIAVALAEPDTRFGGYGELDYGKYNSWFGRASLDVPLGDGFAVKLSGFYGNQDGYVTNPLTGEDLNGVETSGIRGALRVALGEHFRWNVAAAYTMAQGENIINFACDPANPLNCNDRTSTTGLLARAPNGIYTPYAPAVVSGAKANFPLGNSVDTLLVTSNLQWVGEKVTLSLITGVVNTAQDSAIDYADGRALPSLLVPAPVVHGYPSGGYSVASEAQFDSFSQDVRLAGKLWDGRIDYVVGGYFFSENNNVDSADVFNLGGTGIGTPVVLADRRLISHTNSSAGYGQVDFNATKQLTLTAGLRYASETRSFSLTDNRAGCQASATGCLNSANLLINGTVVPTEATHDAWMPRFVARWQQSDALMVYASASNGTGAGGWNTAATTASGVLPYDTSNVWSYEVGLKSQWLDDRLRVNLTGFYINANDVQVTSTGVGAAGALDVTTANVPDFTNKGLELEVIGRPFANLVLTTSIGYQNAGYGLGGSTAYFDEFGAKSLARQQRDCQVQLAAGLIPLGSGASNAADCARGVIDADGNLAAPANAPDWTLAIGGTYNFAIPTAGIVLSPTVNLSYRSDIETGAANATLYTGAVTSAFNGQVYSANPFGGGVISGSHDGSAVLVSAQLAMETDDGNWLVALACDNCFDTGATTASTGNWSYLQAPMTWTIRAKRSF